jgi:hypothetical protein
VGGDVPTTLLGVPPEASYPHHASRHRRHPQIGPIPSTAALAPASLVGMKTNLAAIAAQQGGVVMRSQAVACGYAIDEINHLLRRGEWVSLRRGAYMAREVYDAMTDIQRHLAIIHAVARSLHRPAVVSHVSAVVLRGDLPTWGLDLSEVHVSRSDLHSPRHEAGIHHHAGSLPDEDVELIDGIRVTTMARTILDTARTTPFEASVVVADAAFRKEPSAHKLALTRLDTMRDWRGARNAGAVLAFADSRSESVGESRCRVLFDDIGLPAPDLQREFYDATGRLIGRSDFYFEKHRTIGEFDGKAKYLRSMTPGEDPGDVVWREKKREDRLRAEGYEVARATWRDLDHRREVRERFRAAFARAERAGGGGHPAS